MRKEFLNLIFKHTDLYDSNFSKECEKIADDHAIEFAVWICTLEDNYLHKLGLYEFNKEYREKTFSELLEIYKKETYGKTL
jgi:hypothetical protein